MAEVDRTGQQGGLPKLADDTRAEESIGRRDLTRWPTALGRALVRLVARLSAGVSANTVLDATLLVGLVIVMAFAVGGAQIYDAVAENDGISRLDQPALVSARSGAGGCAHRRQGPVPSRTCRTSRGQAW